MTDYDANTYLNLANGSLTDANRSSEEEQVASLREAQVYAICALAAALDRLAVAYERSRNAG